MIPMNGIGFGRILASEKSVSVCVLSPSLIDMVYANKRKSSKCCKFLIDSKGPDVT